MEEMRHKMTNSRFRFIKYLARSRFPVVRGGEELMPSGSRVSLWGIQKVVELDGGGYTTM